MIHELFAYLCVNDTAKAIHFYATVFDASEKFRLVEPSGRIGHAEMDFGGVTVSATAGTSGTASKTSATRRCSGATRH